MDEEYKISKDKALQAHWDSFFKVIAPQSSVIKKLAQDAFGLEKALGVMEQMPSDLASKRVAAALHLKRPFKELRPDGIFKPQNSNPLVGFEYQSTHNIGMGIRTFLYQEAFDENHRDLIPAEGMRFVILYSGRDAPRSFREKQHLTVTKQSVEYVYIDLEQVDAQKLETDGIYSVILRLARPDATDFGAFESAWAHIETLSDAVERARLAGALFIASANKQGFAQRILGFEMDADIQKTLNDIIPLHDHKRLVLEKKRAMRYFVEIAGGPSSVNALIDDAEDLSAIDELYDKIVECATSRDWSPMISSRSSPGYGG